jgi:uncharacterized protein (DUF2267 family)
MQYDEFIHRVQEYADLATQEEAVQLTKAVLATLGERLYRTERDDLAAQLPKGLKEFLFVEQDPEHFRQEVRRFSLEEFYNRVSARTEVGRPDAINQTKAVMAVLQEAVSAGELADIMAELPNEFDALFQRSA